MPLLIGWQEIALRLGLTVLACGILGWERGRTERAAGLRTVLIVGLAACVAMIQTNLLLATNGKTPDSFAVADVLRLPLGILTGVGFLGAGTILRRGDHVTGLTTAASLWLITIIGLCFGGGQVGLGISASLIALIVLQGLKILDKRRKVERHLQLRLVWEAAEFAEADIRADLKRAGFDISSWSAKSDRRQGAGEVICQLYWCATPQDYDLPPALRQLQEKQGIILFDWSV
jgi:putative Mg2+ transporter-C (MgtC) family protein